jgi:hypothetical protein
LNNDYNISDTIVTNDNTYKQTHDHQYKLNGNADIFKTPQPKLSHKIQTIHTNLKDPHHVTVQGRLNHSKQNFSNNMSDKHNEYDNNLANSDHVKVPKVDDYALDYYKSDRRLRQKAVG